VCGGPHISKIISVMVVVDEKRRTALTSSINSYFYSFNGTSDIWIRRFTVLAIESSADDTCAAVVDSSRKIHSNVVIKQHDVHEVYGGIYPFSAISSHQDNMPHAMELHSPEVQVCLAV